MVNTKRIRYIREGEAGSGPVVYVMQRDCRTEDNWALQYAKECADAHKVPLAILVHIGDDVVKRSSARQYAFYIAGLREVEAAAKKLAIGFFITTGNPENTFLSFLKKYTVGAIVTDFSPLRETRTWIQDATRTMSVPIIEVDAHNVIPCFVASDKEEFAAYTFRPKVRKLYAEFAGSIPQLKKHAYVWNPEVLPIDFEKLQKRGLVGKELLGKQYVVPGMKAGKKALRDFLDNRLRGYDEARNNPAIDGQSNLSPYLHFGHISAARVVHEVSLTRAPEADKRAFLEELVVRRELSDNFCLYQEQYDSYEGLRQWAKTSLDAHRKDVREYLYTHEAFEHAKTHDRLWNAAQMEMVKRGKMHGYLRMYWAKKILEWTKSPEEAIAIGIRLNDTYSLDGCDPNGYVGVLWSMGGVHDRAWFDREVFGKVRYMNYNGCKRKFDIDAYIRYVDAL